MKIRSLIFLIVWFYAFTTQIKEKRTEIEPIKIVQPEFQGILDSSNVEGSILIFDLKKNIYYSNDFIRAEKSFIPASTYKIPNSLIALELGIVEDAETVIKWDGQTRSISNWNQDLTFKQAFHYSCVPCYQEIARKVGTEKMNKYVDDFEYGKMYIDSSSLDMFWLQGISKISQKGQIDFLVKFSNGDLPVSERTDKIAKEMMIEESGSDYSLIGKTGLSSSGIGWYVGYIEKEDNTYFFATNLKMRDNIDYTVRKQVTKDALAMMNFWHLRP